MPQFTSLFIHAVREPNIPRLKGYKLGKAKISELIYPLVDSTVESTKIYMSFYNIMQELHISNAT